MRGATANQEDGGTNEEQEADVVGNLCEDRLGGSPGVIRRACQHQDQVDEVGDHEQDEDPEQRFAEEAVEDPTCDPLWDGGEWKHVAHVAQIQVAGKFRT
jgi:hypothetical protein